MLAVAVGSERGGNDQVRTGRDKRSRPNERIAGKRQIELRHDVIGSRGRWSNPLAPNGSERQNAFGTFSVLWAHGEHEGHRREGPFPVVGVIAIDRARWRRRPDTRGSSEWRSTASSSSSQRERRAHVKKPNLGEPLMWWGVAPLEGPHDVAANADFLRDTIRVAQLSKKHPIRLLWKSETFQARFVRHHLADDFRLSTERLDSLVS